MSVGARPQNFLVDMGPDSFGETKYAGETVVCGKWADALLSRMERAGIVGKRLFYRSLRGPPCRATRGVPTPRALCLRPRGWQPA